MWGSQRKIFREHQLQKQLETDQRTYGSINRENSPTFAGWKNTPVTDLVAVLQNQRQLEVKRLQEEDESTVLE